MHRCSARGSANGVLITVLYLCCDRLNIVRRGGLTVTPDCEGSFSRISGYFYSEVSD